MFRKITNANELKYLDEFLLNKVGGGALGRERSGTTLNTFHCFSLILIVKIPPKGIPN